MKAWTQAIEGEAGACRQGGCFRRGLPVPSLCTAAWSWGTGAWPCRTSCRTSSGPLVSPAADCGMDWKYRQVEDGEWDVMERLGDARYRGQGGGGKGRVDRGVLAGG